MNASTLEHCSGVLTFDDLPGACRTLWAKSGEPQGHSLLCHMLDVSAVALALLEHCQVDDAQLARWFGLPAEHVRLWLALLVGLHDFGKATPGFQVKWPAGQAADEALGLSFAVPDALRASRHDLATAALLPKALQARGAPCPWALAVVQAISAHHGFNFVPGDSKAGKPLREPAAWGQARDALLDTYWHTLAPQGIPEEIDICLDAVAWLAGLTSVCDWIGSNSEWFAPGERQPTLLGHWTHARQLAVAALAEPERLGWPITQPLLDGLPQDCHALIARILQTDAPVRARPLQQVADALLAQGRGPALLVVEAPMGEGKTELAFLASLRLQARQGHRGLYVALPTQATGNAMFERTLTFLRAFADGRALDIQLAHGGALLNDSVARLRNVWGEDGKREAVRSAAWFAQRRRGLLSPYGVGTVDQALFGVMNVKHHFVRLWGLANKVVVLDEVHAYDAYTGSLIEYLLKWLKGLGCSVVLMSATLPTATRQALLKAWGVRSALPDCAYPRVLVADQAGVRVDTFTAREQASIQLLGLEESLDSLAAQALDCLADGGCGAVIVNTVDRAQALFQLLRERVPDDTVLQLFHARYPAEQRREKEQATLTTFGPPDASRQRPQRALLIATQVAEQSLDLDFDFLLSDLAPVDLLLQRAGRLHRHRRAWRPVAHQQPRLWVAGLCADRLPDLKTTHWGHVYGDYLCLVTWAILLREPVWRLPADIDRLVQAVYAPWPELDHVPDEVRTRIEDVCRVEHKAEAQFQQNLAKQLAIDPRAEPDAAYIDKPHGGDEDDTLALRNRTRLGDDSVTVIPLWVDADGLWRIHPDDAPFDPQQVVSHALARQLLARQLTLSRKALTAHLKAQPAYPALAEHPLLTQSQPLLLVDGVCRVGKLEVSLDAELGVCYRRVGEL